MNKNKIIASLATVGIMSASALNANNKVKQTNLDEEQYRKDSVDLSLLQHKRDSLVNDSSLFAQRKNLYVSNTQEYVKNNPQCDDINSFSYFAAKTLDTINLNYIKIEKYQASVLKKVIAPFCDKNGFCVIKGHKYKPVMIEDCMNVINENSGKIPQYKNIKAKYTKLKEANDLIFDFARYITDLSLFVEGGFNPGLPELSNSNEYIEPGVPKYNEPGDLQEDFLVDKFLQEYIIPLSRYDFDGMKLIPEDLLYRIIQISKSVKKYNDMNSRAMSYGKALSKVCSELEENRDKISKLQAKNRAMVQETKVKTR